MTERMSWTKLLSKDRLYAPKFIENDAFDVRSEFQRDFDRLIFSSAFRRLQDKTQVMPLPGSDFVHTRLTHSLEVASVGRSLGKLVGNFVINDKNEANPATNSLDDFGNIVAAACLAHDIGNPPFGHSGEKAIGNAFKALFENKIAKVIRISVQKKDLIQFEGNAAGFRILTNDHPSNIKGGLRLTYATLGAFSKYPCGSQKPKMNSLGNSVPDRKSMEKFGYFFEERNIFYDVASELGLLRLSNGNNNPAWCRHPLSFLVEAADTLTYKIIDLEDAHKIGLVSYEETESLLYKIVEQTIDPRCDINDWKVIKNKDERIGALRSKALNSLLHEALVVFKDNYDRIMTGRFDTEIANEIQSNDCLKKISILTKRNFFKHSLVVDIELAGFEVLGGLISLYTKALNDLDDPHNERLLMKMPDNQSAFLESKHVPYYKKLLVITDFVSRMTDSFAIDLYRKLKGIEISNY